MQTQRSAKQTVSAPIEAHIVFGKNAALVGITSLVRSDEKRVVAAAQNRSLVIEGSDLVVDSLNADEGSASVVGNVMSVRMTASKDVRGALVKLFK